MTTAAVSVPAGPPRRTGGITTRFNLVAAALLLAVGVPGWWLFYENASDDVAARPLDIGALRYLASAVPGPRPTGIVGYRVAYGNLEGSLLASGIGFKNRTLAKISWQIDYPAGGPVVIAMGSAPGAELQGGIKVHDRRTQAMVDRVLPHARAILVTSPQPGQPGGRDRTGISPTLAGSEPQAIAPGVVSIPTPGFRRGSQMVYARLADGREFLFTGKVAPLASSWQELRARPRLVTDYLVPQDRREAFAWLKAIAGLHRQAPALHVVPGYDMEWIDNREDGPRLPVHPLPDTQQPAGK